VARTRDPFALKVQPLRYEDRPSPRRSWQAVERPRGIEPVLPPLGGRRVEERGVAMRYKPTAHRRLRLPWYVIGPSALNGSIGLAAFALFTCVRAPLLEVRLEVRSSPCVQFLQMMAELTPGRARRRCREATADRSRIATARLATNSR
jgi:hypothetical protein